MLLAYWRMAVLTAPPSNPCDRPTQAIRGCPLLDHPVPTSGFRPIVGEAQQIERSSTWMGRPTRVTSSRSAEVDQSGLLWVQAQAVLCKSLWQHSQHPARIFLSAKAQHRIVRVADQNGLARRPTGPKPIRAVQKVLLVNRLEHHDHRPLKDLVFEGRYPDRARGCSIALGDIRPLHGWRSVTARLGAVEQIPEILLQVLRIRVSRLSVYTRCAILPRAPIGLFEPGHVDMVV